MSHIIDVQECVLERWRKETTSQLMFEQRLRVFNFHLSALQWFVWHCQSGALQVARSLVHSCGTDPGGHSFTTLYNKQRNCSLPGKRILLWGHGKPAVPQIRLEGTRGLRSVSQTPFLPRGQIENPADSFKDPWRSNMHWDLTRT